jgi:hypothetical protein
MNSLENAVPPCQFTQIGSSTTSVRTRNFGRNSGVSAVILRDLFAVFGARFGLSDDKRTGTIHPSLESTRAVERYMGTGPVPSISAFLEASVRTNLPTPRCPCLRQAQTLPCGWGTIATSGDCRCDSARLTLPFPSSLPASQPPIIPNPDLTDPSSSKHYSPTTLPESPAPCHRSPLHTRHSRLPTPPRGTAPSPLQSPALPACPRPSSPLLARATAPISAGPVVSAAPAADSAIDSESLALSGLLRGTRQK